MTFNFSCVSKSGTSVTGNVSGEVGDEEHVRKVALELCAQIANFEKQPWDPFNVELVVRAQPEPKPKSYSCPICGCTEQAHLCD